MLQLRNRYKNSGIRYLDAITIVYATLIVLLFYNVRSYTAPVLFLFLR